jgi:L-fuconolactonase
VPARGRAHRSKAFCSRAEFLMRIDAHIHFWKPACGFDNRPVADHPAYRRDFLPRDIEPELVANAIDAVILVQTAPQTQETDWLLALAEREPRVRGVTAWVDLAAEDCDFDALLAKPKVVGIRAQLRRIADSAFIARPHVVANLGAALRGGLGVTILAEQRHHEYLAPVLEQLPDGPITLNHLGMPLPGVGRGAWRTSMRRFAQRSDVFVQFSGLPFLFGEHWRDADARAILDDVLDIYGPGRLMFASDWPMLVRFATYGDWVRAVERYIAERQLSAAEIADIFAGNALRAHPRLGVTA